MTNLAVFKSRAQALDCVSFLRRKGIPSQAISTPQSARVGCGLSVRFEETFLSRVRMLLSQKNYTSFSGYMKSQGGGYVYL